MANETVSPSSVSGIVVRDMDALSQEGFERIIGIAKLALLALEKKTSPPSDCSTVATALEVIVDQAEYYMSGINSTAENVGCNYIDEARSRRRLYAPPEAGKAQEEEVRHG